MYEREKNCKHCGKDLRNLKGAIATNHIRWCKQNPKRKEYIEKLKDVRPAEPVSWNKGLTKETNKSLMNASKKMKELYKDKPGTFTGHKHTEETKRHLSKKARASKHRRLLRSTRTYTKTDGTEVLLDSSWEEILAKRLDELNVDWERPTEPLTWSDNENKERKYFPDFYLPKYDLYLDPKNPYAYSVQKDKIEVLIGTYDNIIFIRTEEECKNYTPV